MLTTCNGCGKQGEAKRMLRMAPNGTALKDANKICPTCIVRFAMDFDERGKAGCLYCAQTAKMLKQAAEALNVYEVTKKMVVVPVAPTGLLGHGENCPLRDE